MYGNVTGGGDIILHTYLIAACVVPEQIVHAAIWGTYVTRCLPVPPL